MFKCFPKFLNIINYFGRLSKDVSFHEFQKKSRKKEIIEKMNKLTQHIKMSKSKPKKSSSSSGSVQSFKYHTQSLNNKNQMNDPLIQRKTKKINKSLLEQRRGIEISTLEIVMKESPTKENKNRHLTRNMRS